MNAMTYKPVRKISDYRYTFPGQFRQQNAYFDFDLDEDVVTATHNPEIGNAIPFRVYHGLGRRYGFNPNLKMGTVNRLGRELIPLWERVRAGMTVEWDGNNNVARLNADARKAEGEIAYIIDAAEVEELGY